LSLAEGTKAIKRAGVQGERQGSQDIPYRLTETSSLYDLADRKTTRGKKASLRRLTDHWTLWKEVGSGVNDGRRKLLALLADPTVTVIVVEHKDRLTRFGFRYIQTLRALQGRSIEVVNVTANPIEDIIADFVSILYSFCARLYGHPRAKRKTEKIVQDLPEEKEEKSA
jgi:predicted site-specific integrase-resolvase